MNFNPVGNAGAITRAASIFLLVSLVLSILPGQANAATVVTFTTTGSTTWTVPSGVTSVSYLVVAGGGGGGRDNWSASRGAGGGGAGGFRTGTLAVTPGDSLTVTVGAGGAGGTTGSTSVVNGSNGGDSTFGSITAVGGGGGGGHTDTGQSLSGLAGGSGGGGSNGGSGGAGTAGQGNNGGSGAGCPPYDGGGGGGAGAAGAAAACGTPGVGGAGTASSISGSSVTYAGGGGGRGDGGSAAGGSGGGGAGNGTAGTANTGGGGGANRGGNGGAGGSGIVIVSYTPPFTHTNITLTKNVTVTGNANVVGALSKGSGTFMIDHPFDPKNKLLYHSFVESPDTMNIYDGIVTLDKKGEVTIELPKYFLALNKDFQYLATALGQPMPNLHVSSEVHRRFWLFGRIQFSIAGGVPNGRVSWQVTGVRHDPFIEANPIVPEVEKGPDQLVDKGKYLFPEFYAK